MMKPLRLKIFYQILIIVVLSAGTGLIYNYFSTDGIPLLYQSPVSFSASEISADEALVLFHSGGSLFIDTRHPQEFSEKHIAHAVNVPSSWSMDQIMNFFESQPRDLPMVIYCGRRECNSSWRLADFLTQIEFTNVRVLQEGFEVWILKNYPVEITEKNTDS